MASDRLAFCRTTPLRQLAPAGCQPDNALLNDPIDVSGDFRDFSDTYYWRQARGVRSGDAFRQNHLPTLQYFTRQAFDNMLAVIRRWLPTNSRRLSMRQIDAAILNRFCVAEDLADPGDERASIREARGRIDAGRAGAEG